MNLFKQIKAMILGASSQPRAQDAFDPLLAKAILFLETACHDDEFALEERAVIERLLMEGHQLSREQASELIELARQHADSMHDVFELTVNITHHVSPEQRLAWMQGVWEIILADGRIDRLEDLFARKLQKLLHLDHREWIKAKLRAKSVVNERDAR